MSRGGTQPKVERSAGDRTHRPAGSVTAHLHTLMCVSPETRVAHIILYAHIDAQL